jgi:hypothetical protein
MQYLIKFIIQIELISRIYGSANVLSEQPEKFLQSNVDMLQIVPKLRAVTFSKVKTLKINWYLNTTQNTVTKQQQVK